MANGATEYIHQVADLGPIIGFAGVLKSATQTLIGLGPLMDKGFEVHFAKTGVGIFLQNKLIYKETYDSKRKLFQINIMDLILPSSPPDHPQVSDDLLVGVNIRLRLSNDKSDEDASADPSAVTELIAPKNKKTERQTDTGHWSQYSCHSRLSVIGASVASYYSDNPHSGVYGSWSYRVYSSGRSSGSYHWLCWRP